MFSDHNETKVEMRRAAANPSKKVWQERKSGLGTGWTTNGARGEVWRREAEERSPKSIENQQFGPGMYE